MVFQGDTGMGAGGGGMRGVGAGGSISHASRV